METVIIGILMVAMSICIFCGNYDKEKENK
jgi:hypothetical protein